MTYEQYLKNLQPPARPIDVVLDTDTYNEIDDQFAVSYLLNAPERITLRALTAAPFFNFHSTSPADGMRRSEEEIHKLLKLAERTDLDSIVYAGSEEYLPDEKTPVESPAARRMVELAKEYSPENPLYIVAIGAITNVASALLMDPAIAENIVIVWLGGNAYHWPHSREFNMYQDVAAARVVFNAGAPVVQLPCGGCVDQFTVSAPELMYWLADKNPLADYLARNTIAEADSYAKGKPWTRVIWDVTAAAWLLNDNNRFMESRLIPSCIPEYDDHYGYDPSRPLICYVWRIKRDALMEDLFRRLNGGKLPYTE